MLLEASEDRDVEGQPVGVDVVADVDLDRVFGSLGLSENFRSARCDRLVLLCLFAVVFLPVSFLRSIFVLDSDKKRWLAVVILPDNVGPDAGAAGMDSVRFKIGRSGWVDDEMGVRGCREMSRAVPDVARFRMGRIRVSSTVTLVLAALFVANRPVPECARCKTGRVRSSRTTEFVSRLLERLESLCCF